MATSTIQPKYGGYIYGTIAQNASITIPATASDVWVVFMNTYNTYAFNLPPLAIIYGSFYYRSGGYKGGMTVYVEKNADGTVKLTFIDAADINGNSISSPVASYAYR